MDSEQNDWDAVARSKLTKILGERLSQQAMAKALATAGLVTIRSAKDLTLFAEALKEEGGLVGVTGALLSLHAVIHAPKPIR